eukprot:6390207-Pyramimonas_sp.AAC.1
MTDIEQHLHFLTGFFGTHAVEGQAKCVLPILTETGDINIESNIHSWAKQLARDIDTLLTLDLATELRHEWQPRDFRRLMADPALRDMYTAVDPRTLRASFFSRQWSPHGAHLEEFLPAGTEVTGVGDLPTYLCEITLADGTVCGRAFPSLAALRARQTRSKEPCHAMRSVLGRLILDN